MSAKARYTWLYPLLFIAALVIVSWYCAAHVGVPQ